MSPQDILPHAQAAKNRGPGPNPQLLRWERAHTHDRDWIVPETWHYWRPANGMREVIAKVISEECGRWFFLTSNGATSSYFFDRTKAMTQCARYCMVHPELGAFP